MRYSEFTHRNLGYKWLINNNEILSYIQHKKKLNHRFTSLRYIESLYEAGMVNCRKSNTGQCSEDACETNSEIHSVTRTLRNVRVCRAELVSQHGRMRFFCVYTGCVRFTVSAILLAHGFYRLVNKIRVHARLRPLSLDPALEALAADLHDGRPGGVGCE